jgi:hypothetical protein
MGRKALRRLELRLPEDHPIFGLPPGARAAVAKACLDLAERLREVSERLAAIEGRLAALEAKAEAVHSGGLEPRAGGVGVAVDPKDFLEI